MQIKKRFDFVDALRGLAILGVIIVHAGQQIPNLPSWFRAITSNGARGVQLFYIVSAFTLFYSLKYVRTGEKRTYLNFFIRRFFRIAPMFYVAIIFFLWKDGLGPRYFLGDAPSITIFNILSTVFFVNGVNPYWITSIVPGGWSIAVEMTFYAILPLLFQRIKTLKQSIWFTLISIIIVTLIKFILIKNPLIGSTNLRNEYLFFWFPTQLPIFGMGIIFFYLFQIHENNSSDEPIYWKSVIFSSFSVVIIIFLCYQRWLPYKIIPFGLAFILFAYSILLYPLKLFVNKFFIYLGKISFSGYLTHYVIITTVSSLLNNSIHKLNSQVNPIITFIIFLITVLPIIILISSATYNFIEKPGVGLGKKLINILENKKESAIASAVMKTKNESVKDLG